MPATGFFLFQRRGEADAGALGQTWSQDHEFPTLPIVMADASLSEFFTWDGGYAEVGFAEFRTVDLSTGKHKVITLNADPFVAVIADTNIDSVTLTIQTGDTSDIGQTIASAVFRILVFE